MTKTTVAQMMTADPTVLHPKDRFERAAREMEAASIRHLPVVDEAGALVGLVSHRDVLVAGASQAHRCVADIMRTDVKAVAPDTPASEAAALILRHKIGCVPVTDEHGRLVGIVTETDFVRLAYERLGGAVPVDQMELEEREADRV